MADAPPVEIKIKGVRQLESGARRLFANIDAAQAGDAIDPTIRQVALTTRGLVPVKSGALQATVQSSMSGGVGHASMGAGLPYARWIEFGGGRGRPYRTRGRYLYPVAKRTERAFRKYAQTSCAHQIGRMSWPKPR